MLTTFPTLYKRNSNGSIQEWTVRVSKSTITTVFGQKDSLSLQTTAETIAAGKNIGRANETTPDQQALAEATSRWEKKAKKGYVETLSAAKSGKVNAAFITGGVDVMLAQKYRDHAAKITFPAYTQPKLDGIRCVAILDNGVCTLWTRTRKPILGVPHVIAALEKMLPGRTATFDGELYNHTYKNRFEEIVSFVRQTTPKPGHEVVEYHVYDMVSTGTFDDRLYLRGQLLRCNQTGPIVMVDTLAVKDEADLLDAVTTNVTLGYEGTMVRNAASYYVGKRSYDLQKIKEFDDAEFQIVGVTAGRGRMTECAVFVCETATGDQFSCKMEGALDNLKPFLSRPDSVIGKMLTVRYQGLTNGNVPRFPIGVTVRDYE